jgi:hypothetical protein
LSSSEGSRATSVPTWLLEEGSPAGRVVWPTAFGAPQVRERRKLTVPPHQVV